MRINQKLLLVLYAGALLFAGAVAVKGYEYYTRPLIERPYSPLHTIFKPGGAWGHGLGILGSGMMLLLFLYSARKRHALGLRFGKIRQWLNIHIFFGIMGPIFVTLHTAFKFGGIVSISYYSMVAVMLSGFVGRYLYVQIPRAISGEELTLRQMGVKYDQLRQLLIEKYRMKSEVLDQMQAFLNPGATDNPRGLAALLVIFKSDLLRPFRTRNLRRKLLASKLRLPAVTINHLVDLIIQQSLMKRKIALLSAIQPMFHYWHVIHKPFAYVMIIIMFIHVGVTLLFGYRWIF
ncbi:MAG TPA: hypothetical protein VGA99_10095 [bacterium]